MTTLADDVRAHTEILERSRGANNFMAVAHAMLASQVHRLTLQEFAASARLHPDVMEVLKAPVAALGTGNTPALFQSMATAFTQSLSPTSVLDRLLALGATRAPPTTLAVSITTLIQAGSPAEAAPKVASSLSFGAAGMTLCKSACFVVASDELVKLAGPGSTALFNAQLRAGVTRASNLKLVGALYALTTPIASSGATAQNMLTDIKALLKAVPFEANSKPLFLYRSDTIKAMATANVVAFEDLDVVAGGSLFGVPVMICNELPNDGAMLIDSTGLILSDEGIELDTSRQTSLQLETAPVTDGNAVMQSLYQSNLVALRAERQFSYGPPRPASLASLSGVNYG